MDLGLAWDDDYGLELVRNMLKPYEQIIADAILTSWNEYMEFPTDKRFPWVSRTRANIIYDYICHQIRHKFDKVSGISIMEETDFLILNFSNLVLLRFKLLDKNLRASNIQTKRQKAYDDQLELPNIPPKAIRVVAGYQLDKAQVAIRDILIVRPVYKNNVWNYSIINDNVSNVRLPMESKGDATNNEKETSTEQAPKRIIRPKNLKKPEDNLGPGNLEKPKDSSENELEQKSKKVKKPKNLKKLEDGSEKKIEQENKTIVKPNNLEKPGEGDGAIS